MDNNNSKEKNTYPLPVFLSSYKIFQDNRGWFSVIDKVNVPGTKELYSSEWAGWNYQTNISVSHPGVLRGMHWQEDCPQGKLVKVLYGRVLDVVVDIRKNSPTFKKVFSYVLTSEFGEQLFVPRGFAHGYYNYGITDAVFQYNIDNDYSPSGERGLAWNSIDFDWNYYLNDSEPIISQKDSKWPKIDDVFG